MNHQRLPVLLALILLAIFPLPGTACTIFMSSRGGQVLVGNNEDWSDCHSRIRFVPAAKGAYGRVYFGFRFGGPQGGMNDQGLFFDFVAKNAADQAKKTASPKKDTFRGNPFDQMMQQCATVQEAIQFLKKYEWPYRNSSCLLCDKTGDAAIIAPGHVIISKQGDCLVLAGKSADGSTASRMLTMNEKPTVDSFRDILAAVRGATRYSNVYNLQTGEVHVYHFQDFQAVKRFNLREELAKGGDRSYELSSFFPRNEAFANYGRRFEQQLTQQAGDEKLVAGAGKWALSLIRFCDSDGDGKLDAAELETFFFFQQVDGTEMFRFDRDGDKKLDAKELEQLILAWCPAAVLPSGGGGLVTFLPKK